MKMKKIVMGVLLIALILSGCSSRSNQKDVPQSPAFYPEGGTAEAEAVPEASQMEIDVASEEALLTDSSHLPYEGAKIIRTLFYQFRTSEYDKDRQFLKELTEQVGGYIENSFEYASGYYGEDQLRNLDLLLRIPSDRLNEFQTRFEADRTLSSKELSQTDVTLTYVDVENRIKNLESRVERYREMLKDAETMGDMIEIERALSDTTFELENYQSQKKDFDSRIDFSQVSITMNEVADPLRVKAKDSFTQRLQEGFIGGINGFIQGIQSIIIFIASNFLWLILLGLIVLGIRKLVLLKPINLRRKKRKDSSTDAEEE